MSNPSPPPPPSPEQSARGQSDDARFVVVASHHLNFYPGTLNPTPPEYRRTLVSEPMSRDAAGKKWIEWIQVLKSPGWDVRVEPASALAAAPPEGTVQP